MDQSAFQKLANDFLEKLFADIEKNKIEIRSNWSIDHLCYRVDSLVRYEQLKKDFSAFSDLLIESDVNGRAIATFKLEVPLEFKQWKIHVVELPAPKAGKPTAEGFEHIEIVCDVPFSYLEAKYAHLNLDRGGLRKALNPELEIVLGARNLKFHHQTLESVIEHEKTLA